MDEREFDEFAANQVHVALGYALAATAIMEIGVCPIGAFDCQALSNLLNLDLTKERPVLMLAIGNC